MALKTPPQRLMSPTRQSLRNNDPLDDPAETPGPGAYDGAKPSAFDTSTFSKGPMTFGTQSTGRLETRKQKRNGGGMRSAAMTMSFASQVMSPSRGSMQRQGEVSERLSSPRRHASSTTEPVHEGSCPGSPHSQPLPPSVLNKSFSSRGDGSTPRRSKGELVEALAQPRARPEPASPPTTPTQRLQAVKSFSSKAAPGSDGGNGNGKGSGIERLAAPKQRWTAEGGVGEHAGHGCHIAAAAGNPQLRISAVSHLCLSLSLFLSLDV
eukprot:COSAG05_NODE_2954_length_2470_cov_1.617461_2_plen_266_part_00